MRNLKSSWFFLLYLSTACIWAVFAKDLESILENDHNVFVAPPVTRSQQLNISFSNGKSLVIACYAPGSLQRSFTTVFTTVTFRVNSTVDFTLYYGANKTDVYRQHTESNRFLNWFLPWTVNSVSVPPFNISCIGIRSLSSPLKNFYINFIVKAVDPWLLSCFIVGIVLFLLARRLSTNIMFHYGTGVTFGLLASLLIVLFILSRFIPKKSTAYAVLGFGFSVTAWLLQYLWQNVQQLIESYSLYIAIYFIVAGLISFAVCYVKGPVTNPRLLDLIKWSIQLIAVLMIYFGCQIQEVTITTVAGLVLLQCVQCIPQSLLLFTPFAAIRNFWRRRFPPKIRLLTEEEYIQQGMEETRKALEELRKFCNSPDCNAWKTISRVNSPVQFAKFVEGSAEHVTDLEQRDYDRNPSPRLPLDFDSELTDDED